MERRAAPCGESSLEGGFPNKRELANPFAKRLRKELGVYCGKTDLPLQIEHINARSQGGSERFSNLTLSCDSCNQKKGNKPVEQFLKERPEILQKIKLHQKKSLNGYEYSFTPIDPDLLRFNAI